jgi:hypothetical protein
VGHYLAVLPAESVNVIPMSWQPEAADYAEAFRARNRNRHVGWLVWAMVALGAAFAVLAVIAGQYAIAAVGVVLAVFFALMGKVGTNVLYQRHPALQQPVQATVDPAAGLAGTMPVVTMTGGPMKVTAGTWQIPWAQVDNVLEMQRVFVVHVTGRADTDFFLLAKRGLADPAQEAALRALLVR